MKVALLFGILMCFTTCSFAQAKKQRLIAQAGYSSDVNIPYSWNLADSAFFVYSGSRHSEFDYSSMQYFNLRGSYSQVTKINGMVAPNNIDSLSYSLRVAFDTLYYYNFDNYNHELKLAWVDAAKYFPDGKCAGTYHRYGTSVWRTNYLYIFDRLTKASVYVLNTTSPPDTTYHAQRFIIYDAFGNAVIDSTEGAAPTTFDYDANARYTDWHLGTALMREYTYYTDGKVKTRMSSEPDSGIYAPKYLDSFAYTSGIPGYTSHRAFWVDYTGKRSLDGIDFFHVNALGQKDTLIILEPWDPDFRELAYVVYNSYGDPEVKYWETRHDSTLIQRTKTVYYYEDYDPTLSVEKTTPAPTINLSPNPTSGTITLRYTVSLPKAPITVTISNMMGQLVHSEAFVPQGSTSIVTLGDDVPAGLYSIVVHGQGDSMFYRGVFVKR